MTVARHVEVLDEIGHRIVGGDLAPGSVFTLAAISTTYEVSRTVAREVMHQLETMGLITSSPRVGLLVQAREEWNALDPRLIRWRLQGQERSEQLRCLTEFRRALEPAAAMACALSASDEDAARLLHLARELVERERAGRAGGFVDVDADFHLTVIRSSGNEMFASMAPVIEEVLRWRSDSALVAPIPSTEVVDAHLAMARAIVGRDPDEARRAAEDMVITAHSQLVADLFPLSGTA